MRCLHLSCLAAVAAASLAAGCGGGDDAAAPANVTVKEGAVVYRDALDDNQGGWFVLDGKLFFGGGRYQWQGLDPDDPKAKPASMADALLAKPIPEGVAVSVAVEVRDGAALRAIACREQGPRDEPPQEWYELGVDGRQALIRRMSLTAPPKVLARKQVAVPNGRRVRLTGQCVPDGDGGLVLALRLDGREIARATDAKPLPAATDGVEASPSIRAYPRPDSPSPATLDWDEFEVRRATVAAG
jgi:hypothetical protein